MSGKTMRVRDPILHEDKVFFIFPRYGMAATTREAAATLNEITYELPQGAEKNHRVHHLEHRGDEIARYIYENLNETLITPLELEEIVRFELVIDEVLDRIDRVTKQICTYGITEQNDTLRKFTYLIVLATTEMTKA